MAQLMSYCIGQEQNKEQRSHLPLGQKGKIIACYCSFCTEHELNFTAKLSPTKNLCTCKTKQFKKTLLPDGRHLKHVESEVQKRFVLNETKGVTVVHWFHCLVCASIRLMRIAVRS